MKKVKSRTEKRAEDVNSALKKIFPNPKISLNYKSPLELLIATILSAQCADERVNKVTPALFKKYRTPKDYAGSPEGELEEDIRSTGFYKNKAKSIRNLCAELIKKHKGKTPDSMEALTALPGVGRKTANVVLGVVFNTPGVIVDTHVGRVSLRLELTKNKYPDKIEQDLMKLIPEKDWTVFSNRMILFGRSVCSAKKPDCGKCPIFKLCPWDEKKG